MSEKTTPIAFTPDKLVDAKKDFRGIIIDAEYALEPFGFKGRADIERRMQMAIKIRTEEYEKDQLEWFPPSDKKLTKLIGHGIVLGVSQTTDIPSPYSYRRQMGLFD